MQAKIYSGCPKSFNQNQLLWYYTIYSFKLNVELQVLSSFLNDEAKIVLKLRKLLHIGLSSKQTQVACQKGFHLFFTVEICSTSSILNAGEHKPVQQIEVRTQRRLSDVRSARDRRKFVFHSLKIRETICGYSIRSSLRRHMPC